MTTEDDLSAFCPIPQEVYAQEAGEAWQGDGLVFATKFSTPVEPRNFNRRTCATLLVDLDVHPRQVMRILRHAQFSVTMEIYAQASSKRTRDALNG